MNQDDLPINEQEASDLTLVFRSWLRHRTELIDTWAKNACVAIHFLGIKNDPDNELALRQWLNYQILEALKGILFTRDIPSGPAALRNDLIHTVVSRVEIKFISDDVVRRAWGMINEYSQVYESFIRCLLLDRHRSLTLVAGNLISEAHLDQEANRLKTRMDRSGSGDTAEHERLWRQIHQSCQLAEGRIANGSTVSDVFGWLREELDGIESGEIVHEETEEVGDGPNDNSTR